MNPVNPLPNERSHLSHSIHIRDCSKYGTFISKNDGAKKKVHELPNKETALENGDLVSFGTGTATYKYVNYLFSVLLFLILCHWLLIFRKYCCSTFLDLGLCRDMQSHYICLFPTYVCLNACKFNLTGFAMYPSFFSSVPQIKWIDPLKRKFHQLVSGEKTCEGSSVLIIHEYMCCNMSYSKILCHVVTWVINLLCFSL